MKDLRITQFLSRHNAQILDAYELEQGMEILSCRVAPIGPISRAAVRTSQIAKLVAQESDFGAHRPSKDLVYAPNKMIPTRKAIIREIDYDSKSVYLSTSYTEQEPAEIYSVQGLGKFVSSLEIVGPPMDEQVQFSDLGIAGVSYRTKVGNIFFGGKWPWTATYDVNTFIQIVKSE